MQTKVIRIDPRKIKLLDINARFMRHETFARLSTNVERDNDLTQIPFGWYLHSDTTKQRVLDNQGDPILEVLSGNHRVQAAVQANLPEIFFQYVEGYLDPDHRRAIQLSHNAISGEDDPALLKQIYESIHEPSMRLYTGFDDKTLKLLQEVKPSSISEANLLFQNVQLVFLPTEAAQVNEVFENVKKVLKGSKAEWLNSFRQYDAVLDALEASGQAYGIKNTATSLMVILEIFTRHVADLQDGWFDPTTNDAYDGAKVVPIISALGEVNLPADVAARVKRAIDKMVSQKKVENAKRWQALDVWARDVLGEQQGTEHELRSTKDGKGQKAKKEKSQPDATGTG